MHPIEFSLRRESFKEIVKIQTCIYLFFCFSNDLPTLSCHVTVYNIINCSFGTFLFLNIWEKQLRFKVFKFHLLHTVNDHDNDSLHLVCGPKFFRLHGFCDSNSQ